VLPATAFEKRSTTMNPNPSMNDVVTAFGLVANSEPVAVSIDRSGVIFPQGGHFQGIQWFPEQSLLVITSSSEEGVEAYFVACDMTSDEQNGRARAPVTMSWYFIHCGGCQSFGNVLVAGVEDPRTNRTSEVQFWDFTRFPMQLVQMTIPRSGPEKVSTAGAVGMTTLGKGTVLAVASYNARTLDFYTSEGDPFQGSPFDLRLTWAADGADKTNWRPDDKFGHYQNINLLTQRDGQLFLVAFYRNDSGEDWMDLFAINLDTDPSSVLTKVATQHMFCSRGCGFDAGAGIFIESPDVFKVLAVNGDSGDYRDGTTIHANIFNPMQDSAAKALHS
jgi:hypothetical protein